MPSSIYSSFGFIPQQHELHSVTGLNVKGRIEKALCCLNDSGGIGPFIVSFKRFDLFSQLVFLQPAKHA
jgi:hypothetical protein